MITDEDLSVNDYLRVLDGYLHGAGEQALYDASRLSRALVVGGLGPEDIVALHYESLTKAIEDLSPLDGVRGMADAHQFLLEVMIGYGVNYKEYLELRLQQGLQDLEARLGWERERVLEAERIGREREELLGVVAHELRQPITVARTNLELAQRFLSRGEANHIPRHILTAREALDRLSRLSGDLVEASRPDHPPLELTRVDLCEVVRQACRWVQPAFESKGINFQCEEATATCSIDGNSDALLSVFGNLLSNAVRYTPSGGQVVVRIGSDEHEIAVSISDTGIGIPTEARERIFEKFYRAPEARQTEPRGLGLGLALVQQLVEAHHGQVEVESAPGKGSTFTIRLPRSES